jgi:hypothetical protein
VTARHDRHVRCDCCACGDGNVDRRDGHAGIAGRDADRRDADRRDGHAGRAVRSPNRRFTGPPRERRVHGSTTQDGAEDDR